MVLYLGVVVVFVLLAVAYYFRDNSKNSPKKKAVACAAIALLLALAPIVFKDIPGILPPTTESTSIHTTQATTSSVADESTSTQPTTILKPRVDISIDLISDNCIIVSADVFPEGGKVEWGSSDEDVACCSDGKIIPIDKGEAVISLTYSYEGISIADAIKVIVAEKRSDPYESNEVISGNNVKLISERTEYKYYRYVCNKCHYRDCYGKATCKESYPVNNECTGEFTELEILWSEKNPNELTWNSFVDIKSIPPEKGTGKEWYWFPEFSGSHNETKKIYEYEDVSYIISDVTEDFERVTTF